MTGLLTLHEAADQLGVSTKTLKRRIRTGALPVFKDGHIHRIREDDLRRYISEHITRTTATTAGGPTGTTLTTGARLWD